MLATHRMPPLRAIPTLAILLCALPSSAQREETTVPGQPTSAGYKPPALSLESQLQSDAVLSNAIMAYAHTGDSATFRQTIESAANSGDIGAELVLAGQYTPEPCTFAPDHDPPNCPQGKNPPDSFNRTVLKIPASYDNAAQWLTRASAQGSGEATEMLAQLITRMLANNHPTSYTAADSTRLHALARSQGFNAEQIVVSCYRLSTSTPTLTVAGPLPQPLLHEKPPAQSFSEAELHQLQTSGTHGTLRFSGAAGDGDSLLLSLPEGPVVHIRIILDHAPTREIHLPIPDRHDVIYLQRGDRILAFPPNLPALTRTLSITPPHPDLPQVSAFIQNLNGSFSGSPCGIF